MPQPRMKVIGKYSGYVLLTLLLTFYFMFLTFPYASLKDNLLPTLEKSLPWKINLQEIEGTPLLWMRLSEVELVQKGSSPQGPLLSLDEIRIRPSLLSLFLGRLTLRTKADLYDGRVKGKIGKRQDHLDLALEWHRARLAKHPLLAEFKGAHIEATTSGRAKLKIKTGQWTASTGTLSFRIDEGSIKDLAVYGFTIPEQRDITVEGKIEINNKKATVETLSLSSAQLSASLDGSVNISPRLNSSRLDLKGKIKLLGEMESQYQPMVAGFLQNQDPEGFFIFSLKGTLENPRFSL